MIMEATVSRRRTLLAAAAAIVMGSGAAAGAAPGVADLVPPNPDAELIELGVQLAAAWRRMDDFCANSPDKSDEGLDAIMEPAHAIVARIEQAEAHTFEGVKVKALAVSWCNWGEPIDPDRFNPFQGAATDGRIAASIVRDLLRGVR